MPQNSQSVPQQNYVAGAELRFRILLGQFMRHLRVIVNGNSTCAAGWAAADLLAANHYPRRIVQQIRLETDKGVPVVVSGLICALEQEYNGQNADFSDVPAAALGVYPVNLVYDIFLNPDDLKALSVGTPFELDSRALGNAELVVVCGTQAQIMANNAFVGTVRVLQEFDIPPKEAPEVVKGKLATIQRMGSSQDVAGAGEAIIRLPRDGRLRRFFLIARGTADPGTLATALITNVRMSFGGGAYQPCTSDAISLSNVSRQKSGSPIGPGCIVLDFDEEQMGVALPGLKEAEGLVYVTCAGACTLESVAEVIREGI